MMKSIWKTSNIIWKLFLMEIKKYEYTFNYNRFTTSFHQTD